jgi:hypothetical protein
MFSLTHSRRPRLVIFAALCALGALGHSSVGAAPAPAPAAAKGARAYKNTFPKLATHDIGDKRYDDPEYQAIMARNDLVIVGFYKGWHHGPADMRAAVRGIKARNPAILVANYTILESTYWNREKRGAASDQADKLYGSAGPKENGGTWEPNDWWARSSEGKLVISPGYPTAATVNVTKFVTPDANGDRYPQWFAKWANAELFSQIPEIDIWYSDNAFYRPRVTADWDRDGKNDLRDDPAVAANLRAGIASFWAEINRLRPGMVVMGNVDGRFDLTGRRDGFLREPEYDGKLQGALLESALGRSFSFERQHGWDMLMESYRSLIDHTAAPHLVTFDTKITDKGTLLEPVAERSGYGGGKDYACLRYALASALMEDGYFAVKNGGYNKGAAVWFDEFDRAGAANTSWLGEAVDSPQRKPYQSGVYLRRFQNGAALVNPRTEPGTKLSNRKAVDVTIPVSMGRFKRFAGKQDPATNNGESLPLNADGVPHLVIEPGDGIVLMREG